MYAVCKPTNLAEIVGSGFSERREGVWGRRERETLSQGSRGESESRTPASSCACSCVPQVLMLTAHKCIQVTVHMQHKTGYNNLIITHNIN